jgi:DUF4097 and DUF4098 domain-containing protein YvlB
MRSRNWLAVLALVPTAALAWGDDCKLSAERTGGIDTSGAEKIVIRAGAGSLKVTGVDASRVDARGKACSNKQPLLDAIQISVRREGNVVMVETTLPQNDDGWSWGNNEYAYLDIDIKVPASIAVDAIDSSGEAWFSDLKSLQVQDSSGELEVSRIAGALIVADSSGDVEIRNAGSVRLQDSSGEVEIDEVRGDVEVIVDSSGDMRISHVGGKVDIDQDSSGSIRVEDVKGSVIVDSDSSGDIYAGRVGGDFTVGSDSSGSIEHESVRGKISVPPHHGVD